MQALLHYFLHLVFPLLVAFAFFKKKPWQAYGILLASMLVDLDHLLANPVFDPNRCSIGFHPLHGYWAMGAYCLMLLPIRTRILAIGLLMHMATDFIDCKMMNCCG